VELSSLTVEELARNLGLSTDALKSLADMAPRLYRPRDIPKKSGGTRRIDAPHRNLKAAQTLLLHRVLTHLHTHPILYGGKGTSPEMAVAAHVRKPLVMTLDLKDFFPSVSRRMVLEMLMSRGASRVVATLVCRLVTFKNHLPQGAPTSPQIARLVLHPAAGHIVTALKRTTEQSNGSIWVDDVTVSGPLGLKRLMPTLIRIFERHGFRVNRKKCEMMGADREQVSLGMKLNNGIAPTSAYLAEYERECTRLGSTHQRCVGMRRRIKKLVCGGLATTPIP